MKRRTHKKRKETRWEKKKQTHTDTHTHTHTKTRRHTTQKRRKTTGRTKNEERKRSDEGESEAEAPTQKKQTQPTKTQKNWPEPWWKLKYLLQKKSSIIKMIARDLLSRRETARNIKQLSLSSWRWMGKEGECSDKYIGTVSLLWPR